MTGVAHTETVWHELECGRYAADLPLWLQLADTSKGPILDVGAGLGRVTLALAAVGHQVTALDLDPVLLAELERRAGGLPVRTVLGDGRDFDCGGELFGLIIAPMQTLQLFGGEHQHERFFRSAGRALAPGGQIAVAIALAEAFEPFDCAAGDVAPLPDLCDRDGRVYVSQPTAVLLEGDHYTLLRRREIVSSAGELVREANRITLDIVDADSVTRAARRAGLRPLDSRTIAPTLEHIGSEVVIFGG